jgi:ethylbenzene hydroxylase subunit alpha/complex iron-sulfur molybdoenzyme family reductase subunit alpha
LRVLPKAIRGLTPRDYEQLFTEYSEKAPNTPLMPWLYVHAGYREMWSRPDLADPALPRGIDEYMRQSIERGWTKIHPPPDRQPRVFIFTGSNPLRRWPAPQIARKHLWPKLDLIVAVNFRMSTSAACRLVCRLRRTTKHGIKYASLRPHRRLRPGDRASRRIASGGEIRATYRAGSQRAAERGVESVRGFNDRPCDLRTAYNRYTNDGRFDPHRADDPVKLMDDILTNSPSIGNIKAEDALKIGAIRITGPARPTPIDANYSDYEYGDTHWPHRWFVEDRSRGRR